MMPLITAMKPWARIPLLAKPNAGMPRLIGKQTLYNMSPKDFAAFGKPFVKAGVNLIGGCCGTTPAHIGALKRATAKAKPRVPCRHAISAVSSSRHYRILDQNKPLMIVGERLNPTGKKTLQQELLEGRMTLVRQIAREQENQGADLLDVNVGVPGIDEVKTIRQVISLLSTSTALPLVIDSPKMETIEAALRYYPGRALINSISGEKEKLRKLLPLAAKYGAMFILLPLTEGEIPETAEKRKIIIQEICREAGRYGLTKDDFVVDGLVMTVASNPQAAAEALKTVQWCTEKFKCRTILGLSNVSFGMPERKWINATFLAMAQALGLTVAIVNPASEELMNIRRAGDVLMQKDRDAAAYIRYFAKPSDSQTAPAVDQEAPPLKVFRAILEGNREDIIPLVDEALSLEMTAARLIDDIMIPAIIQVGNLFDQKTYFLPQLIASAEAMRKGVNHLEPKLRAKTGELRQRGLVLLATVEGDIHDIGKNIVALMLKNHGYKIIDLGKDVSAEIIIQNMRKMKPDVVGLSALMTTTMVNMKNVIEKAARAGLAGRFLLGGAVLTQAYADSIGAAYARDGVEAVRVVERMMKK
jgi:5-methyltetrahydrofolate--homocysteine methyltransferase